MCWINKLTQNTESNKTQFPMPVQILNVNKFLVLAEFKIMVYFSIQNYSLVIPVCYVDILVFERNYIYIISLATTEHKSIYLCGRIFNDTISQNVKHYESNCKRSELLRITSNIYISLEKNDDIKKFANKKTLPF